MLAQTQIDWLMLFLHSSLICLLIAGAVKFDEGLRLFGHPDWYQSHRVQPQIHTHTAGGGMQPWMNSAHILT